ncbi:hypothetical protein [Salinivibrio phage CW02]|uniref:Uncharacterized protein n=1 Tax=Salinivibrio phage CW02 TaxID=1161935 RepID=H9D1I2_9CAUD|nr:hypothetical protein F490_gp13 [Salinivibrio phage CW02]AFE86224.1 hypothetical protein [Salinivibrio phage CW02]
MPTENIALRDSILDKIEQLAQAERITKAMLGELSRDLLEYVVETGDIQPLNRLLGLNPDGTFVLTAANWRVACMYFNHFIPHANNYEQIKDNGVLKGRRSKDMLLAFGKKHKQAKYDKKLALIEEFLADEANNIWTWQADNVEMEKSKVDLAQTITKTITQALEGTEETNTKEAADPLSLAQVLDAVMDADGVTPEALFAALQGEQEQAA